MAKGHTSKKLKTQRKNRRSRLDRQYNLRSAAAHIQTAAFLSFHELILYHLLEACTLSTVIALSHTSQLFRSLVKTLYRIRLVRLISLFVGHENVTEFFHILEVTDSAIGGSSLPLILAPPIDDIDDWIPNNLNIFVPVDQPDVWEEFLARIHLHPNHSQPRIARPYRTVTKSHVEYASRLKNKPIMITESIDKCVITPATAAATTIGMCIATCSTICVLYPDLVDKRRALESWYVPTIKSSIDLETRGYRRSISTMGWSESCGWNCPAVWRRIQGLRGIGVFCWGGYDAAMKDGGSIGVPYTDVAMKWRLGDTCSNAHCPWFRYQQVPGAFRL
ncbi:hypothetical protein B0H11DRAFT_2406692 [Mycena galericulata]|nr:hypothetical protein B0H11DRAFT_2406692 [Mycena galericulata]